MTGPRSQPVCHVCGARLAELWATATDTEYGTTSRRYGYYLCRDCDCISIDPLPDSQLGLIYPPTYYSFASGGDGPAGGGVVARVKDALDARSYRKATSLIGTESPRILDVGGGTGEISGRFVRRGGGASATVVDFDEASIEVARSRGLEGHLGRIEDFGTEERFDLALLLNLIEHVPDPMAVLAKVCGLLSPRGVIWLQTPNFRALDGRLYRHRNWAGYHCPRHFAIFGERGLRLALERSGLEVLRFQRTQGGGFWAQSLQGLARERRMRGGPPASGEGSDGFLTEAGELPKPLVRYRGFAPLAAAGTAFDTFTRPARQISQVVVMARRAA